MVSLVTISGTTNPVSDIAINFSISTYPINSTGQQLNKSSETTNQQGLADVKLKLGNIPTEYGVRAECPDCVPELSSVTFTCCGKLLTDHFSQSGIPEWSYNCYANNNCRVTPNATIGYRGCALTALATLINYYARTDPELNISTTNPGQFNEYLRRLPIPQGYDRRNNVNFDAIERYSNRQIFYLGRYDVGRYHSEEVLINMADGLIKAGISLIFCVRDHFLLVIGKCGSNFIVSDPAGGMERLYNPDDLSEREFEGLRVFTQ